jgi:hypothetical protein
MSGRRLSGTAIAALVLGLPAVIAIIVRFAIALWHLEPVGRESPLSALLLMVGIAGTVGGSIFGLITVSNARPAKIFRLLADRYPDRPVFLLAKIPPFRRGLRRLSSTRTAHGINNYYFGVSRNASDLELWDLDGDELKLVYTLKPSRPFSAERRVAYQTNRRYETVSVLFKEGDRDARILILLGAVFRRGWIRMLNGAELDAFVKDWAEHVAD